MVAEFNFSLLIYYVISRESVNSRFVAKKIGHILICINPAHALVCKLALRKATVHSSQSFVSNLKIALQKGKHPPD